MWRRNVMALGGRVMAYLCTARTLRMRSRHNERRVLHSLDKSSIIIPSLLEKVNAINEISSFGHTSRAKAGAVIPIDPVRAAIENAQSVLDQGWQMKKGPVSPLTKPRGEVEGIGGLVGTETRPPDVQFAQLARLIPRLMEIPVPPLLYDGGGGRKTPPGGAGPQSPRRPRKQCDPEYAANIAVCNSNFPSMSFPSTDIFRRERGLCIREANRVYSDCLTGRNGKPFDPYLFYEE